MRFWFTNKNPYWPGDDYGKCLSFLITQQALLNDKLKVFGFVSAYDVLHSIGIPIEDKCKPMLNSYGWRFDRLPGYIDFGISRITKESIHKPVKKKMINLNSGMLYRWSGLGIEFSSLEHLLKQES